MPTVQPPEMLTLDGDTVEALAAHVAAAKARGWLQPDLRRYFKARGIELETYKAALEGGDVTREAHGEMIAISIHGLPDRPQEPNPKDIFRHIEWLIEPARGAYDDALIEIAYDGDDRGPSRARLFGFDEISDAVLFATDRNAEGRNVYIGAALKMPDTARDCRANAEDFYVGTAVPIDIDRDYDATRARMAEVCQDGLVVVTGMTPARRSQHWTRLVEPCDDEAEYGHAFAALVMSSGADMKVKDSARIMRLGGTVSYPKDAKKVAAGYCTELTAVHVSDGARPTDIATLKALEPMAATGERFDASTRPANTDIERDWTGRVKDGREAHFRDLLLKHLRRTQEETGADPSPEELFESAFVEFCDPAKVDNKDGRWTGVEGRKALLQRAHNTIRRLRSGYLAKVGLASIDTGVNEDEARRVQANREATRAKPTFDTVEGQTSMGNPIDPERTPPGLIRASAFAERKIEPRPWFVPDMIPGRQVTTLDGDGGLGKSTLGLQVCVAAAVGQRWLGQTVEKGPTIYLAAEDDEQEIHRRLQNLCVHYNVGLEDLSDVHVWPLAECDPALVTATKDDTVLPTPRWRELEAFIGQVSPVAIVLDSRADVFGGNEISRSQARGFIGMLRALAVRHRVSVIILAHPSLSGMSSGSGSSGSTHWRNSVRAALYLTKPDEGEDGAYVDPDARLLVVKKSNYGPTGLQLKLRWSIGAFVVDGADKETTAPVDRAEATAAVDRTFLQLLALYNAQGRIVSDRPGASFAPAVFAKDPVAGGIAKGGFVQAMNRLFAAQLIAVEIVGPASRQVRKLVRGFPTGAQ
jgi:RecA-family ATPase